MKAISIFKFLFSQLFHGIKIIFQIHIYIIRIQRMACLYKEILPVILHLLTLFLERYLKAIYLAVKSKK